MMSLEKAREAVKELISSSVLEARNSGRLKLENPPGVFLEAPRNAGHGDIASNFCFLAAAEARKNPAELAEMLAGIISDRVSGYPFITRVEAAGGGFINFTLEPGVYHSVLRKVSEEGAGYGGSKIGAGRKVLIEFVSANPTGPLHVGHARNAAVGDVLANILSFSGYDTSREYYLNDAGKQIDMLGESLKQRHLESCGMKAAADIEYRGSYITRLAGEIFAADGEAYRKHPDEFYSEYAVRRLSEKIREDLQKFGVRFDRWFSEKSLHENGMVGKAVSMLKKKNAVLEKEGALWFRATSFGDDKERVIIKKDGAATYLAADIAYHYSKLKDGYDLLINVWGADHHGYIPRIRGVIEALGFAPDNLRVVLIQLVKLRRGNKPVPMSTRSGEFITLDDVIREVGTDAMRFFMLMRRSDAQLDFDIELAKKQSMENPVYYVQYAHARICSLVSYAEENSILREDAERADCALLDEPEEIALMKTMSYFPEVVEGSARTLEPHRLTGYLQDLASKFHNFYDRFRVVGEDREKAAARLLLVQSAGTVLSNGLGLLGVGCPEKM